MLFQTIASAFFLERDSHDDLATLASKAGMTDVTEFDELTRGALGFSDRQVLGGSWGAFEKTWVIVDDIDQLRCLQLYSSAVQYLDAVHKAREHGDLDNYWPLLAYVHAFRDACLSLNPRAAFLDTKPHYEDERWENKEGSRTFVIEQAPLVGAWDANALANKFFSLLYLNTEMLACLTPALPWSDRDMVEMPNGRLFFARSGPSRMA
jgi:hypothetical protein